MFRWDLVSRKENLFSYKNVFVSDSNARFHLGQKSGLIGTGDASLGKSRPIMRRFPEARRCGGRNTKSHHKPSDIPVLQRGVIHTRSGVVPHHGYEREQVSCVPSRSIKIELLFPT